MSAPSTDRLHASTVAIGGQAVMITGFSGSGKSDLALRLIDRGASLVSDDYTIVTREDGRLSASAPPTIKGKIEVRGLGIIDMPNVENVPVALIVDLNATAPRLPDRPDTRVVAGVEIEVIAVSPFHASAPIKVELALRSGAAR